MAECQLIEEPVTIIPWCVVIKTESRGSSVSNASMVDERNTDFTSDRSVELVNVLPPSEIEPTPSVTYVVNALGDSAKSEDEDNGLQTRELADTSEDDLDAPLVDSGYENAESFGLAAEHIFFASGGEHSEGEPHGEYLNLTSDGAALTPPCTPTPPESPSTRQTSSGVKYKLIHAGEMQLCRLNHTRTVVSKIMNSKYLRRWENHYVNLGRSSIYSNTVCQIFHTYM